MEKRSLGGRTLLLLLMAVGVVGLAGAFIQVVPRHPGGHNGRQPVAAGDGTAVRPTEPSSKITEPSLESMPPSPMESQPSSPGAESSAAATSTAPASSLPPRPSSPQPTPTWTTPQSPAFTPITIEAEAHSNQLLGGAMPVACPTCAGGYRVGYIAGAAEVRVITTLPIAGARTIVVTYESDGLRLMKVSVNGVEIAECWLTGTGWETPYTFVLSTTLAGGPLSLAFYNDVGPAPDLDKVVIT
jgi:hypothetical protein